MKIKDLLDAIDNQRESEEIVVIMNDGKEEARIMVCSEVWDSIEDREINSIMAEDSTIKVWLDKGGRNNEQMQKLRGRN